MTRIDPAFAGCPVPRVTRVMQDRDDPGADAHLVMIHGIADSADIWNDVAHLLPQRFKSHCQMELPWHRGVGDPISYPCPADTMREAWAALPDGPLVVIAHSFGANALMHMSQTTPLDRVAALVMLSPYFKESYAAFTWPLFIQYVNEFEKFLEMSINVRPFASRLDDGGRRLILDRIKQNYSPSSWLQFYRLWSMTPGLDVRGLPDRCLIITGAHDFSIPVADSTALAARIPGAEFRLLEDCSHFAMIENPATTANHISTFLNRRTDQ